LWIKQVTNGGYSDRIEGQTGCGYDLWDDPSGDPDKGLLLSTHVVIIVARRPLTEQTLKTDIPDKISADSDESVMGQLEELARSLRKKLRCTVIVRSIRPSTS
jgi:hypothetical protein